MVMRHHKFCSRSSTVNGAARCPLGGATGAVQTVPSWLVDWLTGCIWTPVHFLPEPHNNNWMQRSPSWEPTQFLSQEKHLILRSTDVRYHIHNSPTLVPILSQINPRHPIVFINIHFHIMLPSSPRSSKWFFPSDPIRVLFLRHTRRGVKSLDTWCFTFCHTCQVTFAPLLTNTSQYKHNGALSNRPLDLTSWSGFDTDIHIQTRVNLSYVFSRWQIRSLITRDQHRATTVLNLETTFWRSRRICDTEAVIERKFFFYNGCAACDAVSSLMGRHRRLQEPAAFIFTCLVNHAASHAARA